MRFEKSFGPPGSRPESFWSPALGHWCGLAAGDLGDLTPAQLSSCIDFIPKD